MKIRFLERSKEIDMLNGPLLGKVFLFALPLVITNMLQVLYNAADMIVAGMSNVKGAIGSIGTTTAMINLILNVFMGFSVGTNVVVARNIGKNDPEATGAAVHSSLIVGLITGVFCGILGQAVCRPVLRLLGDQGHILDLATLYTRIYFAGVPFIALSNYLIAIFRAKGDTATPLVILAGTGLLNVLMNLFFVLVCGMSVDGVALATVLANVASTLLLGLTLMRDKGVCRLDLKKLRLDREAVREIIRDGLPAGVQGALFSLSNMLIQSTVIGINNRVCPGGSDVIDGNAAAGNLEGFAYVATNSVYQASVSFTSQNYGAAKYKRIREVMRSCYFVTGMIAIAVAGILLIFHKPLLSLYSLGSLSEETAMLRMKIMLTPYFTLAFMEVGSGVLRGLGRSTTSTAISLIGSCVFRVIWIMTVVKLVDELWIVYLSYPISWSLTAITHFVFSETIRSRYQKRQEAELRAEAAEASA
ncbi:MAG: MATE family efflux transporter [Clostridiales bacterium]|nr:MATE family efflux transporter [Clostridiales bacterium]